MKKKILIIVFAIIVVIGGIFYYNMKSLLKDQVTMQYDEEVISEYKRDIDFSKFGLETFNKYEDIYKLVYEKDINHIQQALKEQQFTTVELCQYYLTRIRDHQDYNTVIQLNPDILVQAAAVDKKMNEGTAKSLLGVVVLLKDNIAAKGMNTSAGSYALKDVTTSRDATLADALLKKDALIIGKANLSEWSNFMSMPSSSGFSALGGQTKNAYGKFDVGGSSSGSTVSVALGLSTIAIGTETAGSLIYPAGQNSVVALKPTLGLLSRDLIIPIAEAQDTAGVIATTIVDLEKVFHQIVVIDDYDKATEIIGDYNNATELSADYLIGKKLAYIDDGTEEMAKIVKDLRTAGATVVEKTLGEDGQKIDMMTVLSHGINYDLSLFLNNEAVDSELKSLKEVVAFNESNPEYAPYGQALLEGGLVEQENVNEIISNNVKVSRATLDTILKDVDAIISVSNELSGIYAPAGYPALTVPSGYRSNGEPYGVTFVGGYLEDNKLIDIGYAYEQNTMYRKATQ